MSACPVNYGQKRSAWSISCFLDITAEDYLERAIEINKIARRLLKLDTQDATWLQGKISIGLSLQAAELAGK